VAERVELRAGGLVSTASGLLEFGRRAAFRDPFPMATPGALLRLRDAHVWEVDLDIARGSGCRVDFEGHQYLDFWAGLRCVRSVMRIGCQAVTRQAATLVLTSNLYRTAPETEPPAGWLSHRERQGVFCNSGAEANEGLAN
jgi:4-aminobutyrate aminotransferase-like enzyme